MTIKTSDAKDPMPWCQLRRHLEKIPLMKELDSNSGFGWRLPWDSREMPWSRVFFFPGAHRVFKFVCWARHITCWCLSYMFFTCGIHIDPISHGKKHVFKQICYEAYYAHQSVPNPSWRSLMILAFSLQKRNFWNDTLNHHPESDELFQETIPTDEASGFEKVVDSLETFDLMQGDEVNSAGGSF